MFVTPIMQGGNLTIPIAVAANALLDAMGGASLTIIWLLITLSAVVTVIHKLVGIPFLKKNPKLDSLFSVKGIWLVIRLTGGVRSTQKAIGKSPTDSLPPAASSCITWAVEFSFPALSLELMTKL